MALIISVISDTMLYQLIFIQIITFVLLILFLRMLFQRNLRSALGKLHRVNQDVLGKEESLEKRGKEMEKEYAEKMRRTKQEAEGIKDKAEKEALGIKDKILEEARAERVRIIEQAVAEKQKDKRELKAKMARESLSLTSDLIEYMFSEEIKQGIHIQLVDELINELPRETGYGKRVAGGTQSVIVISVYPLKSEQKNSLKKILTEKVGQPVELEEKIDKKIIGGVVIKLGDVVVDGSLRNKLEKAIERVKEGHQTSVL